MTMNIKVGVRLDGMTFGDLYDFVDLTRGAGVPRTDVVQQVLWSEGEPGRGVERFEVALPEGGSKRLPDFSDADLDKLMWALDDVIDSEGDARGQLAELIEIRDRLQT